MRNPEKTDEQTVLFGRTCLRWFWTRGEICRKFLRESALQRPAWRDWGWKKEEKESMEAVLPPLLVLLEMLRGIDRMRSGERRRWKLWARVTRKRLYEKPPDFDYIIIGVEKETFSVRYAKFLACSTDTAPHLLPHSDCINVPITCNSHEISCS